MIITNGMCEAVLDYLRNTNTQYAVFSKPDRAVVAIVGDSSRVDYGFISRMTNVLSARRLSEKNRLLSKTFGEAIKFNGVQINDVNIKQGGVPVIIAGPCAVESEEQYLRIARQCKEAGADILRGGVVKPRSSVHSWQGIGGGARDEFEEGYSIVADVAEELNMPVVSETRGQQHVKAAAQTLSMLQIGARNMYNQDLLNDVGHEGLPVLYKRNFGASIEEYLSFAEYILATGNANVVLCERGMLPFGLYKSASPTRYIMEISAIPVIHSLTYLPVIADPSHGTGRRDMVEDMAYAAIAAGADGLMIEVHDDPDNALVDGPQQITPSTLERIIKKCRAIYEIRSTK
ncbi:MAG: 3-deoxy-7-phosphoheptulonate synthase [Dehalococcoidales bacterium]|nr:3-deoxy-7-phosphoheptulonate synthase [Dehalococcoidales bacterium]